MYPKMFEYFSPRSLEEAIGLLSSHGEEAKLLAGGQSLIPLMKLRMSSPRYLVDINRVTEISQIREENGSLLFGALVRHAEIEESQTVRSKLPILYEAASVIGDVQIRNRGTIGGALAHADPAGDWAPVLLALDARVKCRGPKGERALGVDELQQDAYANSLSADEILTEVSVPLPGSGSGGVYLKFERKAGDFAVASAAVQVSLDENGSCRSIGVGLGAVGLTAIRARNVEALLRGKKINEALIKKAAAEAPGESDPLADTRGSVEYKRHLVQVLCARALNIAVRRARGEEVKITHV
ncbi:MAG: xanthine dehydrogenase family protein subunit M [Acidobacteria bacterium]|nr:xanthine dehydrogenase family protein subunit M [Acidobacteriota bacterium]